MVFFGVLGFFAGGGGRERKRGKVFKCVEKDQVTFCVSEPKPSPAAVLTSAEVFHLLWLYGFCKGLSVVLSANLNIYRHK